MIKKLSGKITQEEINSLRVGDTVEITGFMYTGRDAAHKRLCDLLQKGEQLPIDLKNAIIYYVGPTPAKPDRIIGSAGPTSSYRMDGLTEPLLKEGLKVMIGKGPRSEQYKKLLSKYGAVYLSAIGGAAALLSDTIEESMVVAYEDLGAESIRRLKVKDFFAIVTYDTLGGDLYEEGMAKYSQKDT